MRDPVVRNQLRKQNFDFSNTEEMVRYEAFEMMPRILDKEPCKLTLNRIDTTTTWGMKDVFKALYAQVMSDLNDPCCRLEFEGHNKTMDRQVFGVLKSLLLFGTTPEYELSHACFVVFNAIISCVSHHITVSCLYGALDSVKKEDYCITQIKDAISDLLFSDGGTVHKWRQMAKCETGFYGKALILGEQYIKEHNITAKELPKVLKEARSAAKQDKAFMKQLLRGVPSPDMIGMLYLLKDEHPEALIAESRGGFADD